MNGIGTSIFCSKSSPTVDLGRSLAILGVSLMISGSNVEVVSEESVQLGQREKEKINRKRNTIRLIEFEWKDWRCNGMISPNDFRVLNNYK